MAQLPWRDGVEWYGNPLSDEGAYIITFAGTTLFQIECETRLVSALRSGVEDCLELREVIALQAREAERRYLAEIRARGMPPGIRALLTAKKKKELEPIARDLVVGHDTFADLKYTCRLLGLSHNVAHYEWVSEHAALNETDRAKLFGSDPQALAGKVRQLFEAREHRSVHIFTSADGTRWHCFFLTFKDVGGDPSTGAHHWDGGAHVHFINHLFNPQRITRARVLAALAQREHKLPSIHLRYDVQRERPDPGERIYIDSGTGRSVKIRLEEASP